MLEYLFEYTEKVFQFREIYIRADSEEKARELFDSDEWNNSYLVNETGTDEPLILNNVTEVS